MEFLLLIYGFVAALILVYLQKKLKNKAFAKTIKIVGVLYFIIGFTRLFLPDDFILIINGAFDYGRYFNSTDYLSSFLRWGYQTSLIILPVTVFFKENKYLKRIITFYALPFLILNILYYNTHMEYFLTKAVVSIRYHNPFGFADLPDWFRHLQFSLELFFALALSFYFAFDKKIYKMKIKEIVNFVLLLLPVIFLSLPIYVPQSLFGYGNFMLTGFTRQNFIWVILIITSVFVIYFVFRNQSYNNKLAVVTVMSLALFTLYNSMYVTGVTIPRLPVQLCNLACYLALVAIIFKSQKIFDFLLIANILGTMIAIFVPDVNTGIFSFFHFHFLYEHMLVFIVPVVMLSLGIFKRPDKTALKNALVGFSIYFVFCLLIGWYLNSIKSVTGYSVNYFYIFKDDVLNVFTFLRPTRAIKITWGDYTGYPIYQFVIYVMFSIGCIALYYVMQWLIKIGDNHKELQKIKLKEKKEKQEKKERDLIRKTLIGGEAIARD